MWIEINLGFPQELKVKKDGICVTNSPPVVFGYRPPYLQCIGSSCVQLSDCSYLYKLIVMNPGTFNGMWDSFSEGSLNSVQIFHVGPPWPAF